MRAIEGKFSERDLDAMAEAVLARARRQGVDAPCDGNFFDPERFRQEIERARQGETEAALWKALLRSLVFRSASGLAMGDISHIVEALFTEGSPYVSGPVRREALREKTFDIRLVSGGRGRIKDVDSMGDPDNYPQLMMGNQDPRYFNLDDYTFLKAFLEEAYGLYDPALMRILLRSLPDQLLDPNVLFILIRKRGELKGIGKIKVDDWRFASSVDIGTMYTDEAVRGRYGFGEFIERLAMYMVQERRSRWSMMPHGFVTHGFVSTCLPGAAARHFRHSDVVGAHLGVKRDAYDTSGPVLFLRKRDWENPPHASHEEAPSDTEIAQAMGDRNHVVLDGVDYFQEDSRPLHNDGFLNTMRGRFDRGETMTRLFHPKRGDYSRVIFAFE